MTPWHPPSWRHDRSPQERLEVATKTGTGVDTWIEALLPAAVPCLPTVDSRGAGRSPPIASRSERHGRPGRVILGTKHTARGSRPTMHTRVLSKGQIALPAALRLQDDIRPGQVFEIERIDRGEYRLQRCEPSPNEGLKDWLLSCPEKGFFVGVDSASTDDL